MVSQKVEKSGSKRKRLGEDIDDIEALVNPPPQPFSSSSSDVKKEGKKVFLSSFLLIPTFKIFFFYSCDIRKEKTKFHLILSFNQRQRLWVLLILLVILEEFWKERSFFFFSCLSRFCLILSFSLQFRMMIWLNLPSRA